MKTIPFLLLSAVIFAWNGTKAACQNRFEPFRFALVTDTHIGGSVENEEDLRRTVEDINADPDLAFVILSGDVTEFGSDEELTRAKAILDRLAKPLYVIPGNHDSNWSESGTNSFLKIFGSETFGFQYNGYWFFGMASGPNMKMGPGQIPRENLVWFFNELQQTDKHAPIVFVNHYPMDNSLNNCFEVLDVLRPYNVQLLLCGHGYTNRPMNVEGAHAAMCRSNLRAREEYGGYNIVSVTADSIFLSERIVSGKTEKAWLAYSTSRRPEWETAPPRPDYRINENHPFVAEQWRIEESGDLGGGMALHGNSLFYANTVGEIKSVDVDNGQIRWKFQTGGKIYSTPVVHDGTVWCASSDTYLYGIDERSGNLLHRLKTRKAIVSSPACVRDRVMIAGSDGSCYAWNTRDGQLLWRFEGVKNFVVTRLQAKDGVLFFGSWGNEFYALDIHTGMPRWIWNNGHSNRMFSPAQAVPLLTHQRIYLASPDRYMTVLDEQTGRVIWRHNDPDNRVRESTGISEDGNTVYAKTMDGKILSIDATLPERKIKWISSGEEMGYELAPTPVVEKAGVVYAPTDKGLIYAFRASDGAFLWKYRISHGLINMILPANNGELYVSAMDGKLVKLKISNQAP